MNSERLNELAVEFASGTLDAPEREDFRARLAAASAEDRAEAARIIDAAALLSLVAPPATPSPDLKAKILARTAATAGTPDLFKFVRNGAGDWLPLKVPGAYVKPLCMESYLDYAVVLGKLDPGATYPPHRHFAPEQIYILSGDLSIGEVRLEAGDFHSAAPGSAHGINHSEQGCVILAIISKKDLAAQFAATA